MAYSRRHDHDHDAYEKGFDFMIGHNMITVIITGGVTAQNNARVAA